MKVHFEGRTWELDLSDIWLKPAMVIQSYMGMSINRWVESLNDEADADGSITRVAADSPEFLRSLGAVYWLMKAQNGVQCPIGEVDFPLGAFSQAVAEAQAAGAAQQLGDLANSEPDPTSPPPAVSEPSPEPASIPTPPPSETTPGSGFPDG